MFWPFNVKKTQKSRRHSNLRSCEIAKKWRLSSAVRQKQPNDETHDSLQFNVTIMFAGEISMHWQGEDVRQSAMVPQLRVPMSSSK